MTDKFNEQDTTFVTAKTPLSVLPVASLFFTHGGIAGQEVPITNDAFFIGRSQTNNIVLDDQSVSRKHAVVNCVDGEYSISDLGSLKGTFINGHKIKDQRLLPGDIINIGENRMQFRLFTPSGRWVAEPRRSSAWIFVVLVIILIAAGAGGWFFMNQQKADVVSAGITAKIEAHYERGIEFFNLEHDVIRARREWAKILKLDPETKTPQAVKASKLLKNTEGAANPPPTEPVQNGGAGGEAGQ